MKQRKRRWFRDETLAPWLSLVVIVALWWAGATLISKGGATRPPSRPEAASARSDATPPAFVSSLPHPKLNDAAPAAATLVSAEVADLKTRKLLVPVAGVESSALQPTFDQDRGGGSRQHEALDILAPRGTPVLATSDGRIAKLFTSKAGGLTIYQFDPDGRYAYYYAHLDRYAAGLSEGQTVTRGNVIGYVGTTGNAPPGTPHLHFAIFKLGPEKRWWEGDPVDPYVVLR